VLRFHRLKKKEKSFGMGLFWKKLIVTWAVPCIKACTVTGGGSVGMGRSGTPAPSIQ
jgi:hypothetical protein